MPTPAPPSLMLIFVLASSSKVHCGAETGIVERSSEYQIQIKPEPQCIDPSAGDQRRGVISVGHADGFPKAPHFTTPTPCDQRLSFGLDAVGTDLDRYVVVVRHAIRSNNAIVGCICDAEMGDRVPCRDADCQAIFDRKFIRLTPERSVATLICSGVAPRSAKCSYIGGAGIGLPSSGCAAIAIIDRVTHAVAGCVTWGWSPDATWDISW